jgi:hypothetical protein
MARRLFVFLVLGSFLAIATVTSAGSATYCAGQLAGQSASNAGAFATHPSAGGAGLLAGSELAATGGFVFCKIGVGPD